ncbi:MAG: rod shape-determining protein MreD, partial [Thermoleophilaceae bacterium]|nr:rod shape-determining protein MreD [Thermoleophilaceae bacterium]
MRVQALTAWRLALLALVAVILQTAVMTQFTPFGVVPDFIPALVVCVGLLSGATTGAVFGFAIGLMIDLVLLQTMGVTSLLLTAEGYMAGRLREMRDPVHPLTAPAVGAIASFLFAVGFATIQFSLGAPAPLPLPLIWHIAVYTALGALLAIPAFKAARFAVMPTLGRDDPLLRR